MDQPGEEWRPVVGAEGHYEVSNMGRVRSVDRVLVQGDRYGGERVIHRRGRMLTTTPHKGRATVYVNVDIGRGKRTHMVHLLVLEAFIGPRPPGMFGCHNNGDFRNNRLTNLRWDTQRSNLLDQQLHGTNWARNKTHCPRRHRLVEPNLVRYKAKVGHRACLACQRGRSAIAHELKMGRPAPDMQTISDRKYAEIMEAAH